MPTLSPGALSSAYWVSFGKTGDPNGNGRPKWSRHEPGVERIMNFTNDRAVVVSDPLKAQLDLWQKVWGQDR